MQFQWFTKLLDDWCCHFQKVGITVKDSTV